MGGGGTHFENNEGIHVDDKGIGSKYITLGIVTNNRIIQGM